MKQLIFSILFFVAVNSVAAKGDAHFYLANHKNVEYVGRGDFSVAEKPRFWASGAYAQISFRGTEFELQINDEFRYGKVLNYLEIKVDNEQAYRIQLTGKVNNLVLAKNLRKGNHTIIICKNTEGENGYIEFVGFTCEKILPPVAPQHRKMEFIGDSITCGFGADESEIKCGDKNSNWYDQHNAWSAYGPLTARALNAQWHLSSVSGIGLIHSCCEKKILMPQVYDKVNMAENAVQWDFKRYQPNVVTICLGQNDGVQDSAKFCSAYVAFAKTLRSYYPKAKLVFLTSPMADAKLKAALVKYLTAVKAQLHKEGETNVGTYFFSKQSKNGCGSHPSIAEQKEIAAELTSYLKKTMNW
jgi:lysophospholipase L1-like esterase